MPNDRLVEILGLLDFAVGQDADNNNGKVDRVAVKELVTEAQAILVSSYA